MAGEVREEGGRLVGRRRVPEGGSRRADHRVRAAAGVARAATACPQKGYLDEYPACHHVRPIQQASRFAAELPHL